jgi:hypothetical protein
LYTPLTLRKSGVALASDPRYAYRAPGTVELKGGKATFIADDRIRSMASRQRGPVGGFGEHVVFNGAAELQDTIARNKNGKEDFILK